MKTVETLPDNNENVVYTNGDGQVMLKVFVEVPRTPFEKKWATFYEYDSAARVKLRAEPSAVIGYSDQYADLLNNVSGNYTFLSDTDGLITDYAYHGSTAIAPDYLHEVKIRNGESDQTPTPQSYLEYESRMVSGNAVFVPATSIAYVSDNGTGGLYTDYDYTGTTRIESEKVTIPGGSQVHTIFDAYGRPTWTKDAEGFIHYVEYDQLSGAVVKAITDVDTSRTNNEPLDWITPLGGGLHLVTMHDVDPLGRPKKTTDANGHVTYTVYNDAAHEVRVYAGWNTETNRPSGPTLVMREDRAQKYTEVLTMSALPALTEGRPDGSEPISNLQSLSRTTYTIAGQAIQTDDYFSFAGLTYSTSPYLGTEGVHFYSKTFSYDSRGRLARTQRGDGTIYRTVSDGLGRLVSEWIGPSDANWPNSPAMVKVKEYKYDQNTGGVGDSHLTNVFDALNRETKFNYDYRGRLVETTLPDPDGSELQYGSPVYRTEYDNLDRMKKEKDPYLKETEYIYEDLLRKTTIKLRDPDDGGSQARPESVQERNARGLLIHDIAPGNRMTSYEYDGAGRITKVIQPDPDGPSLPLPSPDTEFYYDNVGNVTSVVDPFNQVTQSFYDKLNRLTQTIDPLYATTTYAYDDAGRLLSLTDPANNATTWLYDTLGRATSETNQLGKTRSFEYDGASRLKKVTQRNVGRSVEYVYNHYDQVTQEKWYNGATPVRFLTYDYDAAGQLIGASDPTAAYTYVYDDLGRVKTETQSISGVSDTFDVTYSSAYDDNGFRTELAAAIRNIPDFSNSYVPDHLQRLTSLQQRGLLGDTAAHKRVDFTYNEAGQFATVRRYAGPDTTSHIASSFYTYDGIGRLSKLTHNDVAHSLPPSGWGGGILGGYIYTYDDASRITQIDSYRDGTMNYYYDAANQLNGAYGAGPSENYWYDPNGNRTLSQNGLTTIDTNNRLVSDGVYSYEYDDEGNRTARTMIETGARTVYEWDHRNRLVKASNWISGPYPADDGRFDDWDWGPSSASGSGMGDPLEGQYSAWGYGMTSAWGSGWPCMFHADVTAATEGDDIVLSVWSTTDFYQLEYWIEDVSTTWGPDYWTPSGDTWGSFFTSGGTAEIRFPTWADGLGEYREAFNVHVRFVSDPYSEVSLEADIISNDLLVFNADVTHPLEGDNVRLTINADPGLHFQYWFEDVSAHDGSDFYGGYNESYKADAWIDSTGSYYADITTVDSRHFELRESFKVHIQLAGDAPSKITLEADILDRDPALYPDGTIDYRYDVHNQLIRRNVDYDGPAGAQPPASTFFSHHDGQIVLQFEGDNLSHRYIWGPAVDQLLADESVTNPSLPGTVLWPLADHLGTIRDIVSYTPWQAIVVYHRNYDSFGNLISETNPAVDMLFGFTGRMFDEATRLQNNLNRWYDPKVGQWISEDPIGFAGGDANLSRYVGNSPTNFADPSGLTPTLNGQALALAAEVGTAKAAQFVVSGQVNTAGEALKQALCNPRNTQAIQAAQQRLSGSLGQLARAAQAVEGKVRTFTDFVDDVVQTGTGTVNPTTIADVNRMAAQSSANYSQTATLANRLLSIDPNRLIHICDNPKHNLGPLVQHCGNRVDAYLKVLDAISNYAARHNLAGQFTRAVAVSGHQVTVQGIVINGTVRINSFWVPPNVK